LKGYYETGAVREEDNFKYKVEGVGKNKVPGVLDIQQVDWSVSCTDN
jgi:cystathionine beta-synthase